MVRIRCWVAAAVQLIALFLVTDASAQTCYRLPFSNPNLADGWGSTCCGRTNPHRGVDFPQASGTPVPAVGNGVVALVTSSACLGNVIVISHADGMFSGYAHLSAIEVSDGQAVSVGQRIGRVGATGTCQTGAHLHLTMSPTEGGYGSGTTVDPYVYITNHMGGVEVCNGLDDDCNGQIDEGGVCERAVVDQQPSVYAAPESTDIDGDGRADLCARRSDGVMCWPSSGKDWEAGWTPIPWTDAAGYDDVTNYATLRMGDLDGDGRADVCARSNDAITCARSNGTGFDAETVWRDGISDANGWSAPAYYGTIRLADIDGDGRDDLCARDASGFGCWRSDGTWFDARVEGPRWSDEAGFDAASRYATLRMGDVDGDGRADVCIRDASGMQCARSEGVSFGAPFAGPSWSDESGFQALQYWSTIRLADVNGDHKADLCVRTSTDLRCAWSTGTGFEDAVIVAPLSDESGWADASNYGALRVGDIDGDGARDLCARSDAGVICYAWNGAAFVTVAGPAWSDASGWALPRYYDTMRLADIDGDGRDDVCARAGDGWHCHASAGTGFGEAVVFAELTDAGGWTEPRYWSTILSAGTACIAETEVCNGRDDDCDGEIDEELDCDGGSGGSAQGGQGGQAVGGDGSGGDGTSGGCGCRVERGDTRTSHLFATIIVGLLVARRARHRRAIRSAPAANGSAAEPATVTTTR